ncbi:MAG: class I SAM-dependent methyltransferase [Planctomycetia bacterium]|nr:class I SAM-dependent methyltransferase [Planctomycetia bacterium]
MFAPDQHQLLDFGAGRKLERFGRYTVDRPSPAAEGASERDRNLWQQADARYERSEGERGTWSYRRRIDGPCAVRHGLLTLELKFTEFGHLGIFPEQAGNWDWLAGQIRAAGRPLKVLNLFAHTGASTLAVAAAGAEVVHVDAASNVVTWARRNAKASNLADAPTRWITEDALKFVRRELKRGNGYDAVILDPPGYGHGPHGETWKLAEHLGELLTMCLELTAARRQFMLLSCHSGELAFASELLHATLAVAPELRREGTIQAHELSLVSLAGDRLHCGAAMRWSALPEADHPNPAARGHTIERPREA